MYKLGILSRDWRQLMELIEKDASNDFELLFADDCVQEKVSAYEAEILLADPGLLAKDIERFNQLAWVQSTWAGVGPLAGEQKQDYLLTGVKDIFGPQMSEFVFTYILYFARHVEEYHQLQSKKQWQPIQTNGLSGKQLGIMGVGSIGSQVAKTAKNFGMYVSGLSRSNNQCEFVDQFYNTSQYRDFCTNLDYLLCLLPDTPDTSNLIDAEFIQHLPAKCVFINAGRGSVVKDMDLINALQNNKIKAAVLDVFDQEPLDPQHPYWSMQNVYVTQHSAAISQPEDIATLFITNYQRFINQQPLAHLIDWQQGY